MKRQKARWVKKAEEDIDSTRTLAAQKPLAIGTEHAPAIAKGKADKQLTRLGAPNPDTFITGMITRHGILAIRTDQGVSPVRMLKEPCSLARPHQERAPAGGLANDAVLFVAPDAEGGADVEEFGQADLPAIGVVGVHLNRPTE
jgi:hypothetical protein